MEKDTLVKKVAEDTIYSFKNRRKSSRHDFFQEAYDFIQTVILKQTLCFDKEISEYIKGDEYRRQNFWECVAKKIKETAQEAHREWEIFRENNYEDKFRNKN